MSCGSVLRLARVKGSKVIGCLPSILRSQKCEIKTFAIVPLNSKNFLSHCCTRKFSQHVNQPKLPTSVRPTPVDQIFEDIAKRYVPNVEYESRKRNRRAATAINLKKEKEEPLEKETAVYSDVTFTRLFSIVWPEKNRVLVGMTATLVSSLAALAFPTAVGTIIDMISTSSHGEAEIQRYVAGMGLVIVAGSAAVFIRSSQLSIVSEKVARNLRKKVFLSVLNQRLEFFDRNNTGRLVNRLATDTVMVGSTLTDNVARFLKASMSCVTSFYFLINLSPPLTFLAATVIPVFAGSAAVYGRFRKDLTKKLLTALARETQVSSEAFSGIRTVQSYVKEKEVHGKYCVTVDNSFGVARRVAYFEGLFLAGGFLASQGTLLGVLLYGSTLVDGVNMTIGNLTSFCMYTGYLFLSIGQVSVAFSEFMKAQGASMRVFSVIDSGLIAKSELQGIQLPENYTPEIKFEDVHFSFPTRPNTPVLQGASFTIKPGESIAITGPSGSGKSTIGLLLSRYYELDAGNIYYGGRNLRDLDVKWLRKQIGEVAQEPILFSATIAENILVGNENATTEDAIKAAKMANAHEFIQSTPHGYDTEVGERGSAFSGGQRQRISIARCLLADSKVMIMDEPTSALDAKSETMVAASVMDNLHGRTKIVFTHNLNVLKLVDRIIVLKDGAVDETGSYDELVAQNGSFSKLVSFF